MSKFTKISFILLITSTSVLSFQVTATQLVIANKDTNRPHLPISGSNRAPLASYSPRDSHGKRTSNRFDHNSNERGFQVLALEGDREKISVVPENKSNRDDPKLGDRYVIGPLKHANNLKPAPFQIEPNSHKIEPEPVAHETNKLILLTDGEHIKLFPLVQTDMSPLALSGGHYIVKSAGFNLTDPSTLKALGPNSTYTKWLKHKQQLIESFRLNKTTPTANLGAEPASDGPTSILPQKKTQRIRLLSLLGAKNSTATSIQPLAIEELLADGELYPKSVEWRKPLITSVGHFFDQRFCLRARQLAQQARNGDARGGATDAHLGANHLRNRNHERCLVVYWLDSRNKFVHLGSLQFNSSTRIELLQTKFDSNGTLKSSGHLFDDSQTSGDRRLIKLNELPPIDLCAKVGVERHNCRAISVSIDKQSLKMYALFALHDDNNIHIDSRIFSAQLELTSTVVDRQYVVTLSQTSLVKSDDIFKSAGLSSKLSLGADNVNILKNSISSTSPFQQTNLLYLDQSTPGQSAKIHSLNLGMLLDADRPSRLLNNEELISLQQTTLLDAQWETAKMKVKRLNSNKLNETFSVIGWALDQTSCSMCWLTSDNELYSSQMGQNDHNLETKFVGKLVPTRPLIRMPITAMQLFHDTLFFVDSTRRSLMAYKLPATYLDSNVFNSHNNLDLHSSGMKDDRVPKLESTHRVLLVEISPIQDFSLIDLSDKKISRSRRSHYSNSCYGLSELLRKKQETSRHLLERSRDNKIPTFHTSTTTTDVALITNGGEDNYRDVAEDVGQLYEIFESHRSKSVYPPSAQENYISYEKIDSDTNYRDLRYVAFLVCCLAAIALLVCFNYFFWVRECNLLAPFLMTSNSRK